MPKQPEPDKTPDEWSVYLYNRAANGIDHPKDWVEHAERILAQGKRQGFRDGTTATREETVDLAAYRRKAIAAERKRIVEELVEAKLLPYAFQVNSRKLLARRKTPLDDGWCHCQKCNHHYDECVCRANRLLRIVNPDVEE